MARNYVLQLSEIEKKDFNTVGEKSYHLSEIIRLNIPVPNGFVLTIKGFEKFLEANNLKQKIEEALMDFDTSPKDVSERIQDIILKSNIIEEIRREIIEEYANMNILPLQTQDAKIINMISAGRGNVTVAVRSSPLVTGQQETSFINVKGKEDLIEAVKRCWADFFDADKLQSRLKNGLNLYGIAVIIQKMVDSEKSGFIKPSENQVEIESVWGLSESLSRKQVQPDTYVVSSNRNIVKINVTKKDRMISKDLATNIISDMPVPKAKVDVQVLDEEQILELADYAKRIEGQFNYRFNIEFAVERNKIFLIETRK